MARPKQIEDEALLESVRATFLEIGPAVSSHEVARRAGVSEGTLFKRFGTKLELFKAAMRLPDMDEEPWFAEMPSRAGEGDLETNLFEIALGLGRHVDQTLPAMQTVHRHIGLSATQIRELCGEDEPPPLKTTRRFSAYFSREMDLGRMRRASSMTLADMFIGAVVHQCHVRLYFGVYVPEDVETFARRLARDFVELTAPAPISR
jgi:AcrR family transcriptional regulator